MKKKIILTCISLIFLLAVGLVVHSLCRPEYVFRVYMDGEDLGTVADLAEYTDILAGLLERAEASVGLSLKFEQSIIASRERQRQQTSDPVSLRAGIEARATYSTLGWALIANNKPLLWTATKEQAQAVVDQVTNFYTHDSEKYLLVLAEIVEPIEICSQEVTPDCILTADAATDYILQGREKTESYVVTKGDNLWTISRSLNVSQAELKDANPALAKSNVLKVGQVLNLVTAAPKLNVRTVEQVQVHESIPFSTSYRYTSQRWSNSSAVVAKGVAGKKAVTYQVEFINGQETGREAIASRVESEPITKVIERGTSRWPSKATGIFRWPLTTGYITSYFGARWGSTHGGVDIGAPTGTSIYAAAAGTVVVAQYGSSYGNYIKIDHGNGYQTLYAHASSLLVKSGQWVSKGQIIARVGSTGNSTGPHLHYEVQRQGVRLNPLQFYKP